MDKDKVQEVKDIYNLLRYEIYNKPKKEEMKIARSKYLAQPEKVKMRDEARKVYHANNKEKSNAISKAWNDKQKLEDPLYHEKARQRSNNKRLNETPEERQKRLDYLKQYREKNKKIKI